MNFFEHQQRARKNTWRLVALFLLAVTIIILLTSSLLATVIWGTKIWSLESSHLAVSTPSLFEQFNITLFIQVTIATIAVVAFVIFLKYRSLQGGGSAIAEQLGGKRIYADTASFDQKQLLNVVEEMAIASGTPVPEVFVLPETSINAFAAGLQNDDAVIGVTRGAVERLNRDQLQGVIAHEFSHLLHGDSRLNVNLIIVLAGIVFLSTAGKVILDGSHRVGLQYSRSKTGLPVLALGVGLITLGFVGQTFGKLIKSAVSRQREFLADASAVQYTRNPQGIGDALKIIGGSGAGTVLMSAHASECSHLFFGDAVGSMYFSLMSTHPPIDKRIRRIQPNWDGEYLKGKQIPAPKPAKTQKKFNQQFETLQTILTGTGVLDPAMLVVADQLIQSIPADLYQSTQQMGSAIALMYAFRLDSDPALRKTQLETLSAEHLLLKEVERLYEKIKNVDEGYVLPLLELAIPALKTLSTEQYVALKQNLGKLISADRTTDYKEWLHYRLICHYLDRHFQLHRKPFKRSYHAWHQVTEEVAQVLSLLAWFGSEQPSAAEQSFIHSVKTLNIQNLTLQPKAQLTLENINLALSKLEDLVPMLKEDFLSACAAGIDYDHQVTFMEWDLLRVTSACIGCPMPLIQRPEA